MKRRLARSRFGFPIMVGLHLLLAGLAVRGLTWFIWPRLAFSWYCSRMAFTTGAVCSEPTIASWIMLAGSTAIDAAIIWYCVTFAKQWRRYRKAPGE